jgi:hypothetical protein
MSEAPAKKKGGLKLILFIVLPVILIGGGIVGCAFMGIINIPGLTPKKKAHSLAKSAQMYGEQPTPEVPKEDPKKDVKKVDPPKKEEPKPDLELGAKRLAKLWNEMDVKTLTNIAKTWKDEDLARILSKMDNAKAVELLSALDAARASKISEIIQLQAAVVASK